MARNKRAAIRREQKEHDKNKLSMNEKQWFIKQTESGIGKNAFEKLCKGTISMDTTEEWSWRQG